MKKVKFIFFKNGKFYVIRLDRFLKNIRFGIEAGSFRLFSAFGRYRRGRCFYFVLRFFEFELNVEVVTGRKRK
jgi:hypothetical protein